MNKIIVALALLLGMFLSACSSSSEAVDLEGVWVSVEKPDAPTRMSAKITDDEMEISVTENDDNSRMLYWLGTVPDTVKNGDIFVSQADVEALETAIFGSTSEEKEFTFKDDELSFEMGMMGVTWTVTMKKVN